MYVQDRNAEERCSPRLALNSGNSSASSRLKKSTHHEKHVPLPPAFHCSSACINKASCPVEHLCSTPPQLKPRDKSSYPRAARQRKERTILTVIVTILLLLSRLHHCEDGKHPPRSACFQRFGSARDRVPGTRRGSLHPAPSSQKM